jgi:hypothetical protein
MANQIERIGKIHPNVAADVFNFARLQHRKKY